LTRYEVIKGLKEISTLVYLQLLKEA